MKLPKSVLKNYKAGTACIRYQIGGKIQNWFVSACYHTDTEESLREHLKKWLPNAEFIGWAIKRKKPNPLTERTPHDNSILRMLEPRQKQQLPNSDPSHG